MFTSVHDCPPFLADGRRTRRWASRSALSLVPLTSVAGPPLPGPSVTISIPASSYRPRGAHRMLEIVAHLLAKHLTARAVADRGRVLVPWTTSLAGGRSALTRRG